MPVRSLRLFAVVAAAACLPLFGQGLPVAAPETVGLSPERLDRIGAAVR